MALYSPTSAIISAVISDISLTIPALIPIAFKGVRYQALGADALLRRNLLIWGLGGVIVPFIGIKLIDIFLAHFFLRRYHGDDTKDSVSACLILAVLIYCIITP